MAYTLSTFNKNSADLAMVVGRLQRLVGCVRKKSMHQQATQTKRDEARYIRVLTTMTKALVGQILILILPRSR